MSLFDIRVPVIALALAGAGVLVVHLTDRNPRSRRASAVACSAPTEAVAGRSHHTALSLRSHAGSG